MQRRVICQKGKQQALAPKVFSNVHITTVHTVNAAGKSLAPFVIFAKNIPTSLDVNLIPQDWAYGCTPSGFMDSELFSEWFHKVFLKKIGRSRPILLALD